MDTPSIPPVLLSVASALVLACQADNPSQPSSPDLIQPSSPDVVASASVGASSSTSGLPEFDTHNFVRRVDNPLFPLPLGRRLVYRGSEDGKPEWVITDVTLNRKTILGVRVVVVRDRVYLDGVLKEKTFDWYAQDKAGNVWYFGEDTKEFDENGKVVSTAGSFEAGKNGAKAGVIMRAHPKLGQVTPQEFAPGVAEDKARPVDLDATVTVPYGTLHHCLKTEEFTALEPGVLENKFYCPNIGIARERDAKGGTVRTGLVKIVD